MKKTILMLLAIVATLNVMAVDFSAKAKIKMTGLTSNQTCLITLTQADAMSANMDGDYCSLINMEGRVVALYVIYNDAKYQNFGRKELGELPLGMMTNADTEYKFSFSSVSGTETLTLYDAVEDKYTDIVEGGSYAFTAAANQTITDRFMLKKKPAEPTICHQYGNLIITGHQGAKVKVLDMADQVAIAEQTLATDDEVISLSSLEKGAMYQVVMDEEVMLIRIQ